MQLKFKRGQLVRVVNKDLNLDTAAEIIDIDTVDTFPWYTIKIEKGNAALFIDVPEYCLDTIEVEESVAKVNLYDVNTTLNIMSDTFKIKNEKYGSSFEKGVDKYGLISALTRMSDKWNRLENLILNNDSGTDDERLYDTLIDLANYCVMTAVYIKNKEKQ
jgi:hypothetical protein